MNIIRLADLIAVPWKNGGGTTREYAVYPHGAGTGDFEWRISRARVAASGAFSHFAGIDRTLTVVEGPGIDLVFGERTVRLDPSSAPYAFAGEDPVEGLVASGAIEDLNVMTRRGRWRHSVLRRRIEGEMAVELGGDHAFLVACGPIHLTSVETGIDLAAGDALEMTEAATIRVTPQGAAVDILVIRLDRENAAATGE
jgi:environmental stress-induced protein Ves